MICTHIPPDLLVGPSKPLSHNWASINAVPVIVLSVIPQSKAVTVTTAAVPKLSTTITVTAERPATKGTTGSKERGRAWSMPGILVVLIVVVALLACASYLRLGHIIRDGGLARDLYPVYVPVRQTIRLLALALEELIVLWQVKHTTALVVPVFRGGPILPDRGVEHVTMARDQR